MSQKMWKPGGPAPAGVRVKNKAGRQGLSNSSKKSKKVKKRKAPLDKAELQSAAAQLLERNRKARSRKNSSGPKKRGLARVKGDRTPSHVASPGLHKSDRQSVPTKGLSPAVRNLKFMSRKANQLEQQKRQQEERQNVNDMKWKVVRPLRPSVDNKSGTSTDEVAIRCVVDERIGREESTDLPASDEATSCPARRSFGKFNPVIEKSTAIDDDAHDDSVASAEDMVQRYASISGGRLPMRASGNSKRKLKHFSSRSRKKR